MHGYKTHSRLPRFLKEKIQKDLKLFPCVVLLGSRQVGKSTLAKEILEERNDWVYLDLERPSDIRKLSDPEVFFQLQRERLVILDEVQTFPDLFPVLRSVIDEHRRPGRFLLLGSASRSLVNQSSESLAGRVSYQELPPILPDEYLVQAGFSKLFQLLLRGGYPESLLAASDEDSLRWRQEYLRSYIERDLPLLGLSAPVPLIQRLVRMLAHIQGQSLNVSQLASSLGVHPGTIRNYLDFLEQSLLVRTLPAWSGNLKKRLVKAPKVYLRDTGLVWALLNIATVEDAMGHPAWGALWESLVVEATLAACPGAQASYYRTSNGTEVDLVLEKGSQRILIEAKANSAPSLTRGFWTALEDMAPTRTYVCAPVDSPYPLKKEVWVVPIRELMKTIRGL